MPAGRPSTYDPSYIEAVLECAREGKSLAQISAALDIPRTTMLSWAKAHDEFSTALTRAKDLEQAWWENEGQDALRADKFNSAVWSKSMSSRFRDEYTDRVHQEHSGQMKVDGDTDFRQLSRAILAVLGEAAIEDSPEE